MTQLFRTTTWQAMVGILSCFFLQGCLAAGPKEPPRPPAPHTAKIKLYQYSEAAVHDLRHKGFILAGVSTFNGPMTDPAAIISQGEKIGADIILLREGHPPPQYPPPYPVGRADGHATASTARGNGSDVSIFSLTTSDKTTDSQVQVSVDHYDYLAVFWQSPHHAQTTVAANNPAGKVAAPQISRFQSQAIEAFSAGDFDTVIALTSKVIALDPSNAEAYSTRCGAKANKGLLREAVTDCRASLAADANFSMAYNNLGYALELQGARQEAARNYAISCRMGNQLGCSNQQRLTGSGAQ